jgi:predicted acyltransferase
MAMDNDLLLVVCLGSLGVGIAVGLVMPVAVALWALSVAVVVAGAVVLLLAALFLAATTQRLEREVYDDA